MRTRTLMLLAIGCGLAILVAGGFQLLRVSGQHESSPLLAVGQEGTAGDATVVLLSVDKTSDTLTAHVRIGGVDDPKGAGGFTLVAPNKRLAPDGSAAGACTAITKAPQECDVVFHTAGVPGTSRQLLFLRADKQLRWVLAA